MGIARIEGEVPPITLSRPRRIDHGWLFATAGLHLRLPVVSAGSPTPGVSVEFLGPGVAKIAIEGDPRWSNGHPISAHNYVALLSRSATIRQATPDKSGKGALIRFSSSPADFLQLIPSPGMVLTPEIHDYESHVTSGPYAVDAVEGQLRTIRYKKRFAATSGPDNIVVVHTPGAADGLEMFLAGDLDVTRTLGADVQTLRTYHSQVVAEPVDLVMGISSEASKGAQHCVRLDLDALASATAGSYTPVTAGGREWRTSERALEFVRFPPNTEVAQVVSHMANNQCGMSLSTVEISYETYLRRSTRPAVPLLEIRVEQNTRASAEESFLPLLRAMTTCLVGDRVRGQGFLRNDATIDWTSLEVFG